MITQKDFGKQLEFKSKNGDIIFIYYSFLKILGCFKLGKKDSYFDVVQISNEGFHIANPYAEGVFIYYEFKQFELYQKQ